MSHLSHMQINVAPGNQSFYKNLLLAMGWSTIYEDDSMYSAAGKNGESLWFVNATNSATNDYDGIGINHLAFGAASQAEVDAAAAYLLGNEVELLFDTPRHRPDFASDETQTYYQIMFTSPDNLLFEVVYTGPKQDE